LTAFATALLLAVGLTACDRTPFGGDGERPMAKDGDPTVGRASDDKSRDRDDTKEREDRRYGEQLGDRTGPIAHDPMGVTPLTQGNNPADLETTQIIRRALVQVEGLSMSAKNITIITRDNVVTLKGSVGTMADHDAVVAAAQAAAGKNRVDDQIKVDSGSTARIQ
jgi:hypothetical protein